MAITLNGTTGITTPGQSNTANETISGTLSVTGTTTLTGATTLTGGIAGDVVATGTVAMGSSFKRNRIINGNMLIDQRNAGASVTPVSGSNYIVDRWLLNASQSSKLSIQQNAGSVTPPVGFSNYLGATSLSTYAVTSTDYFMLEQRIEGVNFADFAYGTSSAQTMTISFWVRSSLTGLFGGALQASTSRYYGFSYTINSANTWEYKTVTIVGDTASTVPTNNTTAIYVRFSLGNGSSQNGAGGSWTSTVTTGITGQVNLVGTNGATFYITGVQLEVGTKATPYEMQIYSDQLAQCQRYYQTGAVYAYVSISGLYETTVYYKQTMRASPTVNLTVLSSFNLTSGPTPDQGNSPTNIFGYYFTLSAAGYCHSSFTASAEL